jgi:hypothetical protein
MAWQTVQYKLTSSAPLIMHNGQLADPKCKWSKLSKQISSKRAKTDADHEEMARLEFMGSLYLDQNGPIIPAHVIDGMVLNAAKKSKEGPTAKSAVFCLEHARLDYDGPRAADELWENDDFRFAALVRVQSSRVVRTRPIFKEWSTVITLQLEDTLVNPARVDEWMNAAGNQVGLMDWRPQHGRFTAQRLNGK